MEKIVRYIVFFLFLFCLIEILRLNDLITCVGFYISDNKLKEVIINISYSVVASYIFYAIIESIPFQFKRIKMRKVIKIKIFKLCEDIKQTKESANLFDLDDRNIEEYCKIFTGIDLYNNLPMEISGTKTYLEYFNLKKIEISRLAENLLNGYTDYLTYKEINVLSEILESYFIVNPIFPIDFNLPEEFIYKKNNNQEEIGASIFQLNNIVKQIYT